MGCPDSLISQLKHFKGKNQFEQSESKLILCRLKSGVATNEDWEYPNKSAIHFNFQKILLDLLQIKLHPLAKRCFTSNIVVAVFSSHEYNRYHRFAAEESVLQSGGVLCPQPGNHLLDLH